MEGDEYAQLMPAITICFLSEVLFPGYQVPHSRFTLCDLEQRLQLTDRVQIHTIELPKYTFQKDSLASAEALAQWAFFLSHAAEFEADALKRLLPRRELVKATGVVEMIAHTPEERHLYQARLKAERDNRSRLKETLADGIAKGREIGLEQGLKQGLAGQVQLLQSMLKEPLTESSQLMLLTLEELNAIIGQLRTRLQLPG
jgi:predicted transposase/invertase (TIGR01784 family)